MKFQQDKNELATIPVKKLLWTYAIPSIISMVVVSLYNIIDRIFIGQGAGSMAISGLALTFPLMSLVTTIGTLIGVGASSRLSLVLHMGNRDTAQKILGNAVLLTFLLSALLILLSMAFLDPILMAIGGSSNTLPYAKEYLNIVIPGSLFTNLCFSCCNIMKAAGQQKRSILIILSGIVLNLILDPILIFGFDMGIRGAAIATVVSMMASSLIAFGHFVLPDFPVRFSLKYLKPDFNTIFHTILMGMPPFISNITACTINIVMNNYLIDYGGDFAIGAYGIIASYSIFLTMVVMGFSLGMQPVVSYNYRIGQLKRAKDTFLLTVRYGIIIMLTGFILGEVFTEPAVRAFTKDPHLTALAVSGLRITFMMLPLIGFQLVTASFFQTIGKAPHAIFMTMSRQLLFLVPTLYVLSHRWGLNGIWYAIPIADVLATWLAFLFLRREKKRLYSRSCTTTPSLQPAKAGLRNTDCPEDL